MARNCRRPAVARGARTSPARGPAFSPCGLDSGHDLLLLFLLLFPHRLLDLDGFCCGLTVTSGLFLSVDHAVGHHDVDGNLTLSRNLDRDLTFHGLVRRYVTEFLLFGWREFEFNCFAFEPKARNVHTRGALSFVFQKEFVFKLTTGSTKLTDYRNDGSACD